MHGGNAGLGIEEESELDARPTSPDDNADASPSHETDTESRLDDFWQLEIVRCVRPLPGTRHAKLSPCM